jgi:hypothetical protein
VVPKSVCRAEAGGCRDLFDQHIDSFQQTPRLMNASLDLFAGRCAGSGSQLTRRWREQDSNPRSPVRGAAVLSAVGAPPRRRPRSMELITRFAWFRRKQQLHFVHHIHGNSNFAIIDNFWDRLLGYLPKS